MHVKDYLGWSDYVLYGLGPNFIICSVKSLTIWANLGASADEIHSILNLSVSIPKSSNIIIMASALFSAFTLPSW